MWCIQRFLTVPFIVHFWTINQQEAKKKEQEDKKALVQKRKEEKTKAAKGKGKGKRGKGASPKAKKQSAKSKLHDQIALDYSEIRNNFCFRIHNNLIF